MNLVQLTNGDFVQPLDVECVRRANNGVLVEMRSNSFVLIECPADQLPALVAENARRINTVLDSHTL